MKDSKAKEDSTKKKVSIHSALDWSVAFVTIVAIAAHCRPEKAFALAANISIVLNLAWDFKGQASLHYDRLFQQAATVNTNLPWHHCEPDIGLMVI